MTQGTVISLEILVIGMGDRGSKSNFIKFVKEQRVDGSSRFRNLNLVRYTLVAGKTGS